MCQGGCFGPPGCKRRNYAAKPGCRRNAAVRGAGIRTGFDRCDLVRDRNKPGSLYHHFAGKEALFTAALEATEARVAATVVQAAQNFVDPLERLRAGCNAWLDLAATDIAVRQIALIDAPSVVGWAKWREIDTRYAFGLLRAGLEAIPGTGRLPIRNIDLFAHALLAILSELSLVIARSSEGSAAEARAVFEEMLDRLLARRPNDAA